MARITKAVIPAAGLGTRFLPATKAQPKEMLPLIDTPTIQLVVEEATASGIEDILVVTGRDKGSIEDHFDRAPELEAFLEAQGKHDLLAVVRQVGGLADLHFIRQKAPLGLGHAVLAAARHVGNDPFAVLLGDDVMVAPRPVLAQLMDAWEPGLQVVAVQAVTREEAPRYGIVEGRWEDGRLWVKHVVEKPPAEEVPERPFAIMGRYILEPTVFDHLRRLRPGVGGEIQLTDALAEFARSGRLVAVPFEGRRYDVGDKLGFVKATVRAALDRPDLREPFVQFLRQLMRELEGES